MRIEEELSEQLGVEVVEVSSGEESSEEEVEIVKAMLEKIESSQVAVKVKIIPCIF